MYERSLPLPHLNYNPKKKSMTVNLYYSIVAWFGLWCLTPLFNNTSVISWRSDLLVEETGVLGDNH